VAGVGRGEEGGAAPAGTPAGTGVSLKHLEIAVNLPIFRHGPQF